MCVVVYYYSDIKICGEGGGAGGRAADQRGAGAAAAARHLGLQRAESKICSTHWNRLRVCRSALVETWPMLGLSHDAVTCSMVGTNWYQLAPTGTNWNQRYTKVNIGNQR